MGTGLTLTAATTAIFLDLPWTEAALAQAEDRLHRIGTTGTVSIICLTARGSIDEKIIEIVKSKRDISLALIDGQMQKLNTKRLIEELLG
jgi:SNF2 family DNA or RNA helicase